MLAAAFASAATSAAISTLRHHRSALLCHALQQSLALLCEVLHCQDLLLAVHSISSVLQRIVPIGETCCHRCATNVWGNPVHCCMQPLAAGETVTAVLSAEGQLTLGQDRVASRSFSSLSDSVLVVWYAETCCWYYTAAAKTWDCSSPACMLYSRLSQHTNQAHPCTR